MVVTSFRPRTAIFATRSGSEAMSMKSSMWLRPKRVGGVLAVALGMMAAVGINPGVATADDVVAPGQHLSLSADCTAPQTGAFANCDAISPGGDAVSSGGGTRVVCESDGGCRYTVTASGQKQGEDHPNSSGSWIRACAQVYPKSPKGPYDKVRLQCSEVSDNGPSVFSGTLKSGDQAILQASLNGTNWQTASVQADVNG
ncbi:MULTISPECIES: hypothetical protein [unclassified Mycobacterium]|uniref:hypothetical protein n=1 Tax=unclassified Mycobacterium TaxID=2642494 RepID=UPI0029C864DD|nr:MULTISPECIES: hypothetical protein [unclassified Mycobacterium]